MKVSVFALALTCFAVTSAYGSTLPNLLPDQENSKTNGNEKLVPLQHTTPNAQGDSTTDEHKKAGHGHGHHRRKHRFRQALCIAPKALKKHLKHVMRRYQKRFGLDDAARETLATKISNTYMNFISEEGFRLQEEPVYRALEENAADADCDGESNAEKVAKADKASPTYDHEFLCVPPSALRRHIIKAVKLHMEHAPVEKQKKEKAIADVCKDFILQVMRKGFILREPIYGKKKQKASKDDGVSGTVIVVDPGMRSEPVAKPMPEPEPKPVPEPEPKPVPEPIPPHIPRGEIPEVIVDPAQKPGETSLGHGYFHWHAHHFIALVGMFFASFFLGYFATKMVASFRCSRRVDVVYEQVPILAEKEAEIESDPKVIEAKIVKTIEETLGTA